MRLARALIASVAILGLSAASFAGDLQKSITKAAQQRTQAQTPSSPIDKGYLWSGGALVAVGMSMALYGFLHTSGDEFVSSGVVTESNTKLGGAGLALAAVGGAILYVGSQHSKHAAAITVAPGRLGIAKRVSW